MQATRITAIRHGETAWNVDTRIQGQLDIALNDKGRWQAERAGAALAGEDICAVVASDLWRAYDTALSIAKPLNLPVVSNEGLRERGFGEFEGKTFAEIESTWPDKARKWRQRDPDFAPEGGESLLVFRERVLQTMSAIAANYMGQHVVIVSHGGIMDVLYRAATGLALDAPRSWDLGNAAINRLLWTGVAFTLVGWADKAHLESDALDESSV